MAHVKVPPFPASPPGFGATQQPSRMPYQGQPFHPYGYYFGYIRSIGGADEPGEISFDIAQYLSGKEAEKAKKRDGKKPDGMDYYILNHTPHERTVAVSPEVTLSHITCTDECRATPIAWPDLVKIWWGHVESLDELPKYTTSESPFWITLSGGVVVDIQEQYLP